MNLSGSLRKNLAVVSRLKLVHTLPSLYCSSLSLSVSFCLSLSTPTNPQYKYYANLLQVTSPPPLPPPPPLCAVS